MTEKEREVERDALDHLVKLAEQTARHHIAYYEREIERNPNNAFARLVLLGWYSKRVFDSIACTYRPEGPIHDELVLHRQWLTKHFPDMRTPTLAVLGESLSEEWKLAAEAHPENASVLANAASSLRFASDEEAIALLRRAIALEPDNPDHRLALADVLSWHPHGEVDVERWEEAYRLTRQVEAESGLDKISLSSLAELARGTKRFEEAEEYASKLHERACEAGDESKRRSALAIRIRIALDRDQPDRAGELLLEMASGRLANAWIRPSERLLKKLVENGQRGAVIEFCRLFDDAPPDELECLENWAIILEAGGSPQWSWLEAD